MKTLIEEAQSMTEAGSSDPITRKEKIEKTMSLDLIYQWAKTGVIDLSEFKSLVRLYASNTEKDEYITRTYSK